MHNATMKKSDYPLNEWQVIEENFDPRNNYKNETIFALGNGFLGMRGTFEENYSGPEWSGLEGTYINGFYETGRIQYGESGYAFPEKSQTMLNITNGKIIKLFLEDEEFSMLEGEVTEYQRELNLRDGVLRRQLEWQSPKGRKIRLHIIRFVSFNDPHLAAIHYEIVPLNFKGTIRIVSALDGNVTNLVTENDPRLGSGLQGRVLEVESAVINGSFGVLIQHTRQSNFTLVCAMQNHLMTPSQYTIENHKGELKVETVFNIETSPEIPITLNKYLSYYTSRDDHGHDLLIQAKNTVTSAKTTGFATLLKDQKDYMANFWSHSDISVKGDPGIQQGIRFNIFHLLQSVGKDGKTSIAAKGLSGEGYEGHYFWDSEMYVLPFFLYNHPEISRKMLEYRYNILDRAKERARQMSHPKGALFAWRTINGEECSAYFPAGTAQYHINADISFAIKEYMEATEDWDFLKKYGAEILFETARLWADLGCYIPKKGNQFCINAVTGPDEYTAIVDNNCYTNLMAKVNMEYAYEVALWMQQNAPVQFQSLKKKIGLEMDELEGWKKAAVSMYIPYDQELQIHLQDDSFLNREPWDFENTPPENYPLLLHYHPLVIYRHQVCKQADLVLALFLLGNQFSLAEKKRDFDYYERVTTHDSSLSTCIFSIVASELGEVEKAYQYFLRTARLDLDNKQGNTQDGIHAANMAGTWLCLVNGFAGMRVYDGELSFNPGLPDNWQEYSFKITFKERLLKVTIHQGGARFELLEGEPLKIYLHGEELFLEK